MKSVVLMYHDIYRKSPQESGFQNATAIKYKVSAESFEKQVSAIDTYLRDHKLPADTVTFTFDDGGKSFLTEAAPILEKYGFSGIFFISTAYIGSDKFLNVDDIKELVRRGHVVGSHSHTHPERISAIGRENIQNEWKTSQFILTEILGKPSYIASIPNGYSSNAVLQAMNKASYTEIYTSAPTTRTSKFMNAQVIGRYVVTDKDDVDSVMSIVRSPLFRFKQNIRFNCLGLAKTVLGDTYLKIRKFVK